MLNCMGHLMLEGGKLTGSVSNTLSIQREKNTKSKVNTLSGKRH